MKIAYLIFAYHNPVLIEKTIARLSGEDCAFFIHLDAKSDILQFAAIRGANVFFTSQRLPVYWAEFSGVEAILLLIRQALAAPRHFDYFVLLSGSEYPLRGREYIHAFFECNQGREFMTMVKMPNLAAGKPISRLNSVRIPSRRPIYRFFTRVMAKLGLAQRDYRKYFGKLEAFSGHTWWALTRAACQYIVEFKDRDTQLTKFFETTFAPEESFFHTILGNSPFESRLRRSLVFEDWSAAGGHPAMIEQKHLSLFEAQDRVSLQDIHGPGELLFARKFSDANLELVDRLNEIIKRKESLVPLS